MRVLIACVGGLAATAALLGLAFARRRAGLGRPVPVYWIGLLAASIWFPAYLAISWAQFWDKLWTEASAGDLATALPSLVGGLGIATLLAAIPARWAGDAYGRRRAEAQQ